MKCTVMSYIWEISDGNTHLKRNIHDHSTTGMGYLYFYIDTETDFGKRRSKIYMCRPIWVYVPSTSRDRWFNDADNIILSTILTGEQVLNLYPELGLK